ncbi:MAG: hypothetical protein GF416_02095 [Candidatus Altiarchaeales archaeon]|nr:hypothetical protein [Candidatus Altiarchaeales archaeon]MBD3415909.1 hypothetical protein [Candidatus Altiarchaeales archaeon]
MPGPIPPKPRHGREGEAESATPNVDVGLRESRSQASIKGSVIDRLGARIAESYRHRGFAFYNLVMDYLRVEYALREMIGMDVPASTEWSVSMGGLGTVFEKARSEGGSKMDPEFFTSGRDLHRLDAYVKSEAEASLERGRLAGEFKEIYLGLKQVYFQQEKR